MVCNTLSSIGAVDIGYTPIQDDVFTDSHVAKRREEERNSKRESLRRKKIQMREKVGKSRTAVFFQ
jgi:hypothetical protein